MLIKCPGCNHENQLGAIFCRNCGDKLEINNIAPEVRDKESVSVFKIIRRIATLIILLAIIGVIAGLFLPFGFPVHQALPSEQEEKTSQTFDAMLNRATAKGKGKPAKNLFTLTPQEVTYLYNARLMESLGGTDGGGGAYNIQKVIFTLDGDDYTHVILETKLGGKFPVRFEIRGDAQAAADAEGGSGINFNVKSAKIGRISLPAALHKIVLDKFQPLLEGNDVGSLLGSLKEVRVEGGAYNLVLK